MRTGTFAPAILASRSRRARIASVPPNTTASGGISPRGWTRGLIVVEELIRLDGLGHSIACIRRTKRRNAYQYMVRLVYLLEEKQLTKDSARLWLVIPIAGLWRG